MSNVTLFENQQFGSIRILEQESEIWFVAKDVCAALGIGWAGTSLQSIPTDWQGMWFHHTPRGRQKMKFISEPAVYKLAFRSNKAEADAFTNWVASEVLPAIRKTGKYVAKPIHKSLPEPDRTHEATILLADCQSLELAFTKLEKKIQAFYDNSDCQVKRKIPSSMFGFIHENERCMKYMLETMRYHLWAIEAAIENRILHVI